MNQLNFACTAMLTTLLIGCGGGGSDTSDLIESTGDSANGFDSGDSGQPDPINNGTTDLEDSDNPTDSDTNDNAGNGSEAIALTNLSGNITISIFKGSVGASAGAFFTRLPEPVEFDTAEQLVPFEDDCRVSEFDAMNDDTESSHTTIERISAGEVITFTSPAGTWVELIAETSESPEGDILIYNSSTELFFTAPDSLVVDIPGDVFPAFSAQQIPIVTVPQLTSPANDEIVTPNTRFEWAAGSANSFIDLTVSTIITDTSLRIVNCTIVDDGSFTFDDETQQAMGADFASEGFFDTSGIQISRTAIRSVLSGDAGLILKSIAYDFGFQD